MSDLGGLNSDGLLEGLNEEQRAAVECVTGPVCILAGAGSGKTTTITRRIAYQVASGAFGPSEILAVTFTDKAAKEMSSRLKKLGVPSVRAATFHAEARGQQRDLFGDNAEVLASKVQVLKSLVQALPMPYRFTAVRDIATEIEWAKNQMIGPGQYEQRLGEHQPPIPVDLMASIFRQYEGRKSRSGMLDFEDLLARALELLESSPPALERVRTRYRSFTVDEYQDVNFLQQSLLSLWLGDREELCVVGDDYQSIYGFTGATPAYLLGFKERFPGAQVVQLTLNYRSTASILESANVLVPRLRGSSKVLRPTRPRGEPPVFREFATGKQELDWIVSEARKLNALGISWDEMAVLYRINARSGPFEEALAAAGIPFQVVDSPFLRRPGPRSVLNKLRGSSRTDVAAAVSETVKALGYSDGGGDVEGEEATRQADLGRLLLMAEEFGNAGSVADFISDVVARFTAEEDGRGVHLMTLHRAKGKEYEAVFLPRMEEGELPFSLAKSEEQQAEELRLLYVGITRAKQFLAVSWARSREGERRTRPRPSPFLAGLRPMSGRVGVAEYPGGSKPRPSHTVAAGAQGSDSLFANLRIWRSETAKESQVPAFVVFHDSTLSLIAEMKPRTPDELLRIKGIGSAKGAKYGAAILELINRHVEGGAKT